MGCFSDVAINEAVFLLDRLSPSRLNELRGEHPSLATDIKVGVYAGPDEVKDDATASAVVRERAQIMISALAEAGGPGGSGWWPWTASRVRARGSSCLR